MRYRINYGNGQVSKDFLLYSAARAELLSIRDLPWSESFRIQTYLGDGEWGSLGKAGRLQTSTREGLSA